MDEIPTGWNAFTETSRQSAVLKFLNGLGYQRSAKQFSVDHKKGLIKKDDRGLFTRRACHQYAKKFLTSGSDTESNPEGFEARKLKAQAEKYERENEEGRFKFGVLKGRYIPRQEMYLHLAGRAAVLDAGLEQTIRAKGGEWIALVSGDATKISDLVEAVLAEWKTLINNYANSDDMEVLFTGEVVADED